MKTQLIASATVTLIVGATAPAFAQQAGAGTAGAGTNGRPASAGTGGAPAAAPSADLWQLRQDNGGSLLQAQNAASDGPAGADAGASHVPASSLYTVAEPEPHVLKKHDLVNIVVREESKSASGGQSNQQRQVDFDAKVDAFVRFKAASFSLYPTGGTNPEVKLEGQRDFTGTGEYDRTDSMTTRLEAEVIDVKPNGTLVLQARRHMQIDEERIDVSLTGICRVKDVDPTNSVLSTDMHDLDLKKLTTGQVHDTTKRGVLHQILDFLNPF